MQHADNKNQLVLGLPTPKGWKADENGEYTVGPCRASVKLFELGVRTPVGLFWGIWYAGGIDWAFSPTLPIFGVILSLRKATKMYKLFW